jgi:hypothetical protein
MGSDVEGHTSANVRGEAQVNLYAIYESRRPNLYAGA